MKTVKESGKEDTQKKIYKHQIHHFTRERRKMYRQTLWKLEMVTVNSWSAICPNLTVLFGLNFLVLYCDYMANQDDALDIDRMFGLCRPFGISFVSRKWRPLIISCNS